MHFSSQSQVVFLKKQQHLLHSAKGGDGCKSIFFF